MNGITKIREQAKRNLQEYGRLQTRQRQKSKQGDCLELAEEDLSGSGSEAGRA